MNSPVNLIPHINVKLSLLGFPPVASAEAAGVNEVVSTLVAQYREKERLLANHLCPVDQRIQTFLFDYLQDVPVARLPLRTFILDRPGMARALSLPVDCDHFSSDIVNSYRAANGVLMGRTTGRGKASNSYIPNRSIKEILGLALTRRFRELLSE